MDPIHPEPVSELPEDESDFEDELTVLEYARLQSLALDHLNPDFPLMDMCLAYHNYRDSSSGKDIIIPGALNLPSINTLLPQGSINPREYLSTSQESLLLLASLIERTSFEGEANEVGEIINELLHVRSEGTFREKLELPILKSDHELDVASWGGREKAVLEDLNIPSEPLSQGEVGGPVWENGLKNVVGKIDKEIRREKLALEAKGFGLLAEVITDGWSGGDDREVWEREVFYKGNMARQPLTPPLQLLSPPTAPFIPSPSVMELPFLSDPPSLLSADLYAIEAEFFKDDTIAPLNLQISIAENDSSDTVSGETVVGQDETYSALAFLSPIQTSPVLQRNRVSDHKVEVPLTPLDPPPRTVTFSHIIEELIFDPYPEDGRTLTQPSHNGFEEEDQQFFLDALGPLADSANRKVQQEQLKSVDSIGRVKVPLMDFSLLPPPWASFQFNKGPLQRVAFRKAFIRHSIEEYSISPIWRGIKRLERELKWVAFPLQLGKVALDEQIEDGGGLKDILSLVGLRNVIASSDLTWKPEGLRILKDDEEDDEYYELELGCFSEKQFRDMSSLIQKHKLGLLEGRKNTASCRTSMSRCSDSSEYRAVENMAQGMESKSKRRKLSPAVKDGSQYLPAACQALLTMPYRNPGNPPGGKKEQVSPKLPQANPATSGILLGGTFSADNALDNFMQIRGSKKQKPTKSSHSTNPSKQATKMQNEAVPKQPQAETEVTRQSTVQSITHPKLKFGDIPRNVVISSNMLKNRQLIRELTTLIPTLTIIERDFSAHKTTIWQLNTFACPSISAPLESEADIIISASTSIIITSLQAIKQKPLPGSRAMNKVVERVLAVSPRYERIVVFIVGIDQFEVDLNEDDCLKLTEFMAFCSAPPFSPLEPKLMSSNFYDLNDQETPNGTATILPMYIPLSPQNLAIHIAATISKYGSTHSEPFLLEETVWELFLRRAGMNAFASQSVISLMVASNGFEVGEERKEELIGIRAFVRMGREERLKRFAWFAGRRVIERVGSAVDGVWM